MSRPPFHNAQGVVRSARAHGRGGVNTRGKAVGARAPASGPDANGGVDPDEIPPMALVAFPFLVARYCSNDAGKVDRDRGGERPVVLEGLSPSSVSDTWMNGGRLEMT